MQARADASMIDPMDTTAASTFETPQGLQYFALGCIGNDGLAYPVLYGLYLVGINVNGKDLVSLSIETCRQVMAKVAKPNNNELFD